MVGVAGVLVGGDTIGVGALVADAGPFVGPEACFRWSGRLDEADRLPLPPQESVARFQKRWDDAAKARTELSRDLARSDKDLLTCTEKIEALRREGDVPTVGELDRRRGHRDRGWELVRRTLEGVDTAEDAQRFDGDLPLADAYERSGISRSPNRAGSSSFTWSAGSMNARL